ncbi:MAG: carbonic anhydrase [Acidiferrobacterales bacterium]|nr:carbonic anhydrase [Acidiferrobacterales bacterium]
MIPAEEALSRLKEGNARYISGNTSLKGFTTESGGQSFIEQQHPIAIVLGCSDARVPAELVFDQGLGDLFVIRVAGNIVAPSQIGSIEFAAAKFGVRLVVVLGHTRCGAVEACVSELQQPAHEQSRNLASIVNRIRPAVEPLLDTEIANDREKLLSYATRANVMISVSHLRHTSEILEKLIASDGLQIVGAQYSIETGEVSFF